MAKIYDGLIPFVKRTGDQLSYVEGWYDRQGLVVWKENEIFEDVLEYDTFERGRSAAHMVFTRSTGATVVVFLADFHDMIPHMKCGKVKGKFAFCKRGANYGCKMVLDGE